MERVFLGLVGAGIQGSMAATLHEEEGRHHGLQVRYRLIDLDAEPQGPEALPRVLRELRAEGIDGFNVTFPCKQSVIPLLDVLSPESEAIGAVNTVVREGARLVGHNTDGSGWSWGFRRALPGADLARVVLLGAGGAGSACADAVLRLGARQLHIVDKDPAQAEAVAARLNHHLPGNRAVAARDLAVALAGASGLIQATPVGMVTVPGLPMAPELLRASMWVSEIVYRPLETELLKAARRIGCAVADGGHMNVGQAVDAFKLFTGRDANPARMEAHFRKLVA